VKLLTTIIKISTHVTSIAAIVPPFGVSRVSSVAFRNDHHVNRSPAPPPTLKLSSMASQPLATDEAHMVSQSIDVIKLHTTVVKLHNIVVKLHTAIVNCTMLL
jgi:hypothetical protein